MVKNLLAMRETQVWSLNWGDSPGEENGNSLQYSCLENSMDGGVWQATVHGVAKSRTELNGYHFHFSQLRLIHSSFLCDLTGLCLVWKKAKIKWGQAMSIYSALAIEESQPLKIMFWQTNSKQTDTWKTLWSGKGKFPHVSWLETVDMGTL